MVGIVAAILVAAPGVDQMREIELVDPLVIHEVEEPWEFGGVVHGHGEAHAGLEATVAAQAQTRQGFSISAITAAEGIVSGADAVKAHADVVVADGGNVVDISFGDQRAIA